MLEKDKALAETQCKSLEEQLEKLKQSRDDLVAEKQTLVEQLEEMKTVAEREASENLQLANSRQQELSAKIQRYIPNLIFNNHTIWIIFLFSLEAEKFATEQSKAEIEQGKLVAENQCREMEANLDQLKKSNEELKTENARLRQNKAPSSALAVVE